MNGPVTVFAVICLVCVALEFGLPQFVRMVGGPVFSAGEGERQGFFDNFKRRRRLRLALATLLGLVGGGLVLLGDSEEMEGLLLLVMASIFGIVVMIAIWSARAK